MNPIRKGTPLRVVVTGGAGFIGANLVRALSERGDVGEVVVVDDLSTGAKSNLAGLDVELREGTILDRDVLDDAFSGADAVVHLAARPSVARSIDDPFASHEANTTGTLHVLETVRNQAVPYMVAASSSSVYGDREALPKHELIPPAPRSPYAASKLAAEAYVRAYAAAFDIDALVFRFFNVFGPLQPAGHAYAAAIPAFVDAALREEPIPIFGDGKQTRDFTYVGSVVGLILEALEQRVVSPEPVNLAFGSRRSLLDVISMIEALVGHELEREHLPPRPGDVRHSQADSERLHALFPSAERVSFEDGLRETISWFRNQAG